MTHKVSRSSPLSLMQRSLAAYYRAGGIDHPDPHMFGHFMAEYEGSGSHAGYREYVRLADTGGTLAVFRIDRGLPPEKWSSLRYGFAPCGGCHYGTEEAYG